MEQRRLQWTTCCNISTWFDTLIEELMDLGFARVTTEEDKQLGVEGELSFLPRQADRVMSLDESEASLDGTSKNGSGRPGTQYCSTNENIPRAATSTNKSGTSCTIICGSTAAYESLPPHLQNKSEALE